MGICARSSPARSTARALSFALGAGVLVAPAGVSGAQASAAKPAAPWTMLRTPEGHPDLQGNWTNATMTPIERPRGQPRALSAAQLTALEKERADTIEKLGRSSNPDRPAPPVGGDGSTGAAGNVGGYNYFWIDAGNRMASVNGESRSSLIVDPEDGRLPALTPAARDWATARGTARRAFGPYDHPELRPLGERCIMSFGSNAGPPMLPNYFYNNNYTIVQTRDHVMILTEMVHDVRIIPMGSVAPLPAAIRPWMGDSRGRWEGDTLVIETTGFHPMQTLSSNVGLNLALGATDSLSVTERLHRVDEQTILYRFTVRDPVNFTRPWGGEVPFLAMTELIYEYACHEGNYALSNILSGARAQEREAARKPPSRPPR